MYAEKQYAFGKTPFSVRVARYVMWFGPTQYIPVHPGEYYNMLDTSIGRRVITALEKKHGLPILPLGTLPSAD